MPADAAYQICHDELNLDGNPALNLASFVTTWMEPEAERLIVESLNKNYVDQDEYPQTTVIQERCVNMLARLFHAPHDAEAVGTGDGRLIRGDPPGRAGAEVALAQAPGRRRGSRRTGRTSSWAPTCRSCWEKFARYFDVEPRYVPCTAERAILGARRGHRADRREHDRRRRRSWGAPTPASTSRSRRSTTRWLGVNDASGLGGPDPRRCGQRRLRRAVPPAGSELGLPPARGQVDQRLGPQVRPRVPRRRLGRVARPSRSARGADLPRRLPRRRSSDLQPQFLQGGRAGRRPVLQLPPPGPRGLPPDHDEPAIHGRLPGRATGCDRPIHPAGRPVLAPLVASRLAEPRPYTVYDISERLRAHGWVVPAYHLPANAEEVALLRIVVREHFSRDMADMLLDDLTRVLERLDAVATPTQAAPAPKASSKIHKVC